MAMMSMGEAILWMVANPMKEIRRCRWRVNYRFTGNGFELYGVDAVEPQWEPVRAESMLFDNNSQFQISEPQG